jgi:NTE family protein
MDVRDVLDTRLTTTRDDVSREPRGERLADLVLEGGGVKGIGLVGAVSALHDRGYRFCGPGRAARVAGTSAGAIVGSLVAAGMPVEEMVSTMRDLDYRQFRDGWKFGPIGRGLSLLTSMGVHRGDYLHRWIADRLAACGVRTFADLRLADPDSSLPPSRRYRLVVIVSDVTTGRMVRLPWDYERYGLVADEQPVADAIRASASIPFFFRPFSLTLPGGAPSPVHTDGGMLSNFPINVFDRSDGRPPRWPTFGIKLSGRPADSWLDDGWSPVRGPLSLARALLHTMMNAHDRLYVDDPAVCARTMFVETNGVKATDFGLTAHARRELYENGREAAADFLAQWSFAGYRRAFPG